MTKAAAGLAAAALALVPGAAHGASAACSGLAFGGGCLGVVGSLEDVRPADNPSGTASANLTAAQNEFESFQLVLRAGAAPLTNLSVSLAAGGTIPADAVTIYREDYLDIATKSDLEGAIGKTPDALIPTVDPLYHEPRTAFPITVPSNESRVVWVDLLAKPSLSAGTYDGALHVTANGATAQDVPMHLTVLPFSMPSTPSLMSVFDLDTNKACVPLGADCSTAAARDATFALFVREALDDRVTIAKPSDPPYDKTVFEQATLPYVNGTGATRLAGARVGRIFMYPWCDAGCLTAWRTEARAQGFENRLVYYACDEPYHLQPRWDTCKANADAARATWGARQDGKRLPAAVTGAIRDAVDFGSTADRDAIDVFIPNVFEMHGKPGDPYGDRGRYLGDHSPDYAAWKDADHQVWLYNACDSYYCYDGYTATDNNEYFRGWPGFAVDEPAFEQRSLGWLSYRYGATGQYYFETLKDFASAWTNQFNEGGNGDGTLFYPGTTARIGGAHAIPLESMRLKRIRDGIEDYELLHILDARGGADKAYAQDRVAQLFGADAMWTVPSAAAVAQARADLQQRVVGGLPGGGTAAIAFTSTRNGNKDVYAVEPDGTHEVRLTTDPADDSQPAWSPDGTRIAFTSTRGGTAHVWVMNADGSGQTQLSTGNDSKPAWSPDGMKLAFVRHGASDDVWTMNANGTSPQLLVATAANEYDPAWSPDGTSIVFSRAGDLYRVPAGGGAATQLTSGAADEDTPAWSHSGARIAYDGYAGDYEVYAMNGDGSAQTNTSTSAATHDFQPAWSPDDAKLVFARAGGAVGIWTMSPSGTSLAQVTSRAADADPDWRPAATPLGRSTGGALTCGTSPRLATGAPTVFARDPAAAQWIAWRTTFWRWTGSAWVSAGTGPWLLTSATAARAGQQWWQWNGASWVAAGSSATVKQTNAGSGSGYFSATEELDWYGPDGQVNATATKQVDASGGPNAVAHQPWCYYAGAGPATPPSSAP